MRPTCETAGCLNVVERRNARHFKRFCTSCRRRHNGRHASGSRKRKYVEMKRRTGCEACGLQHEKPAFFDVHHIDGNPRNNDSSNLIVLCPNCHREADLGLVDTRLGSPLPEGAMRLFDLTGGV